MSDFHMVCQRMKPAARLQKGAVVPQMFQHHRSSGSCIGEQCSCAFLSRLLRVSPNDRLTPRTGGSCIYGNG